MLKHLTEDTCQGIGRLFAGSVLSPFLKIGDTFASFQMDWSLPVSRDFLYISCRMGASSL